MCVGRLSPQGLTRLSVPMIVGPQWLLRLVVGRRGRPAAGRRSRSAGAAARTGPAAEGGWLQRPSLPFEVLDDPRQISGGSLSVRVLLLGPHEGRLEGGIQSIGVESFVAENLQI